MAGNDTLKKEVISNVHHDFQNIRICINDMKDMEQEKFKDGQIWEDFGPGTAAIGVGVFFIGFLGEYVLNINIRVMRRPLVIEECRINFKQKEQKLPVKE